MVEVPAGWYPLPDQQAPVTSYVELFAWLIWPLGPTALALGILGWRATGSGAEKKAGRGRSMFAIIVGALSTIALVLLILASLAG